jgi:type II secretory pathway pseudopilin PulG
MPKSRKRQKTQPQTGKVGWGGKATAGTRRLNVVIAAVALAAVVAGGVYWVNASKVESAFEALAAQGRDRLDAVETKQSKGRRHLSAGESYNYGETFPTSGPHALTWAPTGFHETAPHPTLVVHALEHGNIVIYYDQPGDEVLETLEDWTGLYTGRWDGLLAVPMSGLGKSLMLTAWTRQLRIDKFDAPLAAAFIDAYRGRGPEHPVR